MDVLGTSDKYDLWCQVAPADRWRLGSLRCAHYKLWLEPKPMQYVGNSTVKWNCLRVGSLHDVKSIANRAWNASELYRIHKRKQPIRDRRTRRSGKVLWLAKPINLNHNILTAVSCASSVTESSKLISACAYPRQLIRRDHLGYSELITATDNSASQCVGELRLVVPNTECD